MTATMTITTTAASATRPVPPTQRSSVYQLYARAYPTPPKIVDHATAPVAL
jgi:hypothetical protein